MIRLMIREMARNECPPEQYLGLGLPEPRRLGQHGHGDDELLAMPGDEAIRAACVLQTEAARFAQARGANGCPKLPFGPVAHGLASSRCRDRTSRTTCVSGPAMPSVPAPPAATRTRWSARTSGPTDWRGLPAPAGAGGFWRMRRP